MIIVKLIGGLGNQLFQYSLGRNLAHINQTEFKLDITGFETYKLHSYSLQNFNIIENFATKKEVESFKKKGLLKILEKIKPYYKRMIIRDRGYDKNYDFDANILKAFGSFYLDGHWQSEKYFKDIESIIRKDATLKEPLPLKYMDLINNIKNSNSVSLHIRRKDYLSEKIAKIYGACNIEYYYKAIEKITRLCHDPQFFIFSDDIDWVKQNLNIPYPKIFVSGANETKDYEELILMSLCKHNITANSSFSWWGAWLNQNPSKIVISPDKWFNDKADAAKDLIPQDWIRL